MRSLSLGLIFCLSVGCAHSGPHSSKQKAPRKPSQVHDHEDPALKDYVQSQEFLQHELEPRRHTFIFLDEKGEFGYHVSQFESPHQHQLIVKAEVKTKAKLVNPQNGYFSLTSNEPKFRLREIFEPNASGKTKDQFPGTIFDGLIISENRKVDLNASFRVVKQLFHSPLVSKESYNNQSVQIVFGNTGVAKKIYYTAHLINGAVNFEQLLKVEFSQEVDVPDGHLLMLTGIPDEQPLEEGQTYAGVSESLDLDGVTFKVLDQVYFDVRNAQGKAEAKEY